jgi:hypothetical protein
MTAALERKCAMCASEIALAESIRTSRVVPDPLNVAYLKGAKAAMKLLDKKLSGLQAMPASFPKNDVLITRSTRYAAFTATAC